MWQVMLVSGIICGIATGIIYDIYRPANNYVTKTCSASEILKSAYERPTEAFDTITKKAFPAQYEMLSSPVEDYEEQDQLDANDLYVIEYNNRERYDVPLSEDVQDLTYEIATYYGFSEKLIYQIMDQESDYDPTVSNSMGNCHGIMQIHENYWYAYLDRDDGFNQYIKYDENGNFCPFDVKSNIIVGVRQLAYWYEQSGGDESMALDMYFWGFDVKDRHYSNGVYSNVVNILE